MTDQPTGEARRPRIKPTLDTKFHIDYEWWERQNLDLRTYIVSLMPEERRSHLMEGSPDQKLDQIDSQTAEVIQVDAMEQALREAVEEIEFSQMPLVDGVFKVFLMNGNQSLSPNELAAIVGRPARTILRTFSSTRVYRGIRPVVDE